MRRRPRHRGARLPGLFGFEDGTPTAQLDEVPDNPRLRPCTWCHADTGEPCTRRSRNGRRIPIHGYHDTRKSPQETP